MKAGHTWAALDVEYKTRDEEVLKLRHAVGKLYYSAWWPALIAACKKAGPSLIAHLDLEDFAREVGDERDMTEIVAMLQQFVDAALLDVAGGALHERVVSLRLHSGETWQVAPGTVRSRKSRAKNADDTDKKPAPKRKPAAKKPNATKRNTTQRSRARTDSDSDTETETEISLVSETRATSTSLGAGHTAPEHAATEHAGADADPSATGAEHVERAEPAERRRGTGRGKLTDGVEHMVEQLLAMLPNGGISSRRNFFDLAHQGATEADIGDAIGALRSVDGIHDPARYVYTTLKRRLDARSGGALE